ncbi:MAG: ATP-binding cassette domain-containing protein [Longimicrobiales bacterium]
MQSIARPTSYDAATPAISCRGLIKRYGDVLAVDRLDLEVRRGECFGLLGPNGAGKTTTVEILEGLLEPDAGDVRVLGLDWRRAAGELRRRIGVQLQETRLPEKLTVAETLRLFASFYGGQRSVEELLGTVQLGDKRDARVSRLSGGQRQRLAVACGLVGDPDIFFLDEPTTGLDPQSRRSLWELLDGYRASGRTVLLTTHYMEEATRLCDRVAIIDHGRTIALGTPSELIAGLGADHVVELTLADHATAVTIDLGALPGVRSVQRREATVALTVTELHTSVPLLLDQLAQHGVALTGLSTHHATLEDVFVALTGRALREE